MSAPSRGPQLQDHVVDVEREAGGAGVKNLGVQKDIVERSSPLDSEVRDLAVATLTNDFLNVADLSLDLRAYLVETTLPSAVLALEKLIREVERRRLLEDDAQLTPAGGTPQPDKPLETTFNPINWLAQYLYRNNPRYSNFTDPLAAPYIASMQHIGDHLKARLFELHTNRRARLHAEELARKREDERMRKALLLKQEEKRNLFSELLCSVFRKWMAPGFLMKTEIIDALRAVLQADNIQSDDSMITKVSSLLNAFSTSPDVSEKARSAHEEQQKLARAADTGEKVELKPLDVCGIMIFIMGSADPEWTQEEMTVFLTVISTHIEEVFGKLLNDFAETVVVPGIKAEWKRRLGRLVEGLMNGEEVDPDLDVAEIKAIRVDPGTPASTVGTRVGTAAVVSWRAGSVSGSVLGGVVGVDRCRMRLRRRVGYYLRLRMRRVGLRRSIRYRLTMVMEQDLPGRTTGEEAVDRRGAMLEAFAAFVGVVRPETNPEGVVLPETLTAFYNKIMESSADVLQIQTTIDMVLERGGLDGRLRGILEMMKKMEEGLFSDGFLLGCCCETFAMLMNQGTSKETNSSTEGSGKPASKEIDRDRIERSAIGEITRLARRQTITIKEAANESLQVLTNALTALHPSHMVRGRLAVEDHTATAASPTESPRQFKFVACSEDIKEVLNSPMGDAETKVLRESKLVKEDGEDNDIVRRVEAGSPVSPSAVSKFLGVPMCSPVSGKPPKLDGGFNEPDVKFVETATTAILDTLDKVDRLNIYLNEPETWADPPKFFKVESFSTSTSFTADVEEGGKATDRPMSPKVSPMPAEDPITKKGEMNPEDLDDVRRVTSILASVSTKLEKKSLEKIWFSLEGERIDEDARRGLLFSKMMLMNARDLLGKLDNRALAELRSYKKPPAMIHKCARPCFMCLASYLKKVQFFLLCGSIIDDFFRVVKLWSDTEKIRFKRCNRVLKRDVKNRGSTPAMYMHEWLRNRRPEVYQVLQQSALKSLGGEDEADDDEDADDDGSTRSGERRFKDQTQTRRWRKGKCERDQRRWNEMEGGIRLRELDVGEAASIRNSPSRSSLKNVADIAAGGAS
ncbi:hypothetical protein BC829DRAFT_397252 [Chytridium lagenaria]|nr:hypothetical protein BC829DRAFT_397252 [Chytridium lagenaria]